MSDGIVQCSRFEVLTQRQALTALPMNGQHRSREGTGFGGQ
jgi:hypothetical protein